MHYAYTDS